MKSTEKMDVELKGKWVSALKSKDYKQIYGKLYSKERGGYCSLGVLGVCLGIDSKVMNTRSFLDTLCTQQNIAVPLSEKMMGHIMRINDTDKYSFDKVAEFVEDNL
jgi:hypothetical protein